MRPGTGVPLDRPDRFLGPFPSGAPAIFASVAARLGASVELCAAVGQDAFGRLLRRRLAADGVGTEAVVTRSDLATAVAFVSYATSGDREFVFHVRRAAAGSLCPDDLGDLPERASWLHVSGSSVALGAGLAETVSDAVSRVRAHGGGISLDPNIRPEAFSAEARELLRSIALEARCVFPSEGELSPLGLSEEDLAASGTLVCTTRGRLGAVLVDGTRRHEIRAPAVREIDPTGAGDAFAAAFSVALLNGARPLEAARAACRVGARAVQAQGPMEVDLAGEGGG